MPVVAQSLRTFPAVLLLGPRQVGKSTLARQLLEEIPGDYATLDEPATLAAATTDPDGLAASRTDRLLVLDEVQRAPDLLRACKLAIDRDRRPGRFLLTGSADLTTLEAVAETLAGRVVIHRLHPFSLSELVQRSPSTALELAFTGQGATDLVAQLAERASGIPADDLRARVLVGGMPVPALLPPGRARDDWFASYLQTYVERDLLEMAGVHQLPDFRRLLTAVALRTGRQLNHAELSRDLAIPATTLRRFFAVLQQTFQVQLLPPFLANPEKRLVKTPKVFAEDSGIAAHLVAAADWATADRQGRAGALLETWVHGELRKLVALSPARTEVMFWRAHLGQEVDFVLTRGDEVVGIEVKAGASVRPEDLAGLQALLGDLGERFRSGIVLHGGTAATVLGPRLCALPLPALF